MTDRFRVFTRAGGFRRWVCVDIAPTRAAAQASVARLRAQDDPMWLAAEYLIDTCTNPGPDTPANVPEA